MAETSILSVLTLIWPPLCPVRIYVSICSNGKVMCPHLFTWSQWNLKVVHKILYPCFKYQLLPGKLFPWQPFREGLAIFYKFENSPNGASILLRKWSVAWGVWLHPSDGARDQLESVGPRADSNGAMKNPFVVRDTQSNLSKHLSLQLEVKGTERVNFQVPEGTTMSIMLCYDVTCV